MRVALSKGLQTDFNCWFHVGQQSKQQIELTNDLDGLLGFDFDLELESKLKLVVNLFGFRMLFVFVLHAQVHYNAVGMFIMLIMFYVGLSWDTFFRLLLYRVENP